jgi:hypothetical protein
MKPISIIKELDRTATDFQGKDSDDLLEAQRIVFAPQPGTAFNIKGVKSLTDAFTAIIVEAKIGDNFVWPEGVTDVGLFKDVHPYFEMALGEITEEVPLELYVKVFGTPSVLPFFNFSIFGEERVLSAEEAAANREAAERRVGLLHFKTFRDWLDQAQGLEFPNVEHVVAAFLAGQPPPKEEVSEKALLKEVTRHATEHGGTQFFEGLLSRLFPGQDAAVAEGLARIRRLISERENQPRRTTSIIPPTQAAQVASRVQQRNIKQKAQAKAASAQATQVAIGALSSLAGAFVGGAAAQAAQSAPPAHAPQQRRGKTLITHHLVAQSGWYGAHRVETGDEVKIYKENATGLFSLYINNVHQDWNLSIEPTFCTTKPSP